MLEQIPPELLGIATLVAAAIAAYLRKENKKAKKKITQAESDLRSFIREQGIFPTPNTENVERSFVDAQITDAIPSYDGSAVPVRVVYSDGLYYAPEDKATMQEAKDFNPFEYLPYRPEYFDCEDYAMAYSVFSAFLWGTNTVGTVFDWSAGHAYNIIVYSNGEVEFYEPQSSEVVELGDQILSSDKEYKLENALVLF